jgi:hypothetical protein
MGVDHDVFFEQFRNNLGALSAVEPEAMPFWKMRCKQLIEDSLAGDRFNFLRWPSISEISPNEGASLIYRHCYLALRHNQLWRSRWFNLTRELKLGHPHDFSLDLGTSPLLVQHAFHLLLHNKLTKKSLTDCKVVVEFGGGYGSFCRLLFRAGFKGLYLLYDLPHMIELQRFYLRCAGFNELAPAEASMDGHTGICLLASSRMLMQALQYWEGRGVRIAFVATWSLSESPMDVRRAIVPNLHRLATDYLLSYQPIWCEINNEAYFADFCKQRCDLTWTKFDVPGSVYLLS